MKMLKTVDAAKKEIKELQDLVFLVENYEVTTVEQKIIDDIKPFMESHGFETLNLVGSSNIGSLLSKEQWAYWQNRGENEFGQLIELLIETATDSNVLGTSSHLLYIGKKKDNIKGWFISR